jgi:hypothetical protein
MQWKAQNKNLSLRRQELPLRKTSTWKKIKETTNISFRKHNKKFKGRKTTKRIAS